MKIILSSPLVNVLLFSFFWALEILNTKIAFLSGADLIPFTYQSSIITFLMISIYVLIKKLASLKKLSFKLFKWLLLINILHAGLGNIFSNAGIQLTTAINAGFLMQFTTVTITVIAWILLKERMTMMKVISIFVILLGSFLLVTRGQLIVPHLGDIFILLACTVWGVGTVLSRKILKNTTVDADIVTFFRAGVTFPFILILLTFSPLYPQPIQEVFSVNLYTLNGIVFVLLNSLFTALMWFFANRSLKIASASYSSMMSSVTPVIVAVLASIFLNESIDAVQFIGIFLIIAASIVTHKLDTDKH